MEELFVGNSIIILFWVYISFIIEVEEKNKKVILMYLITYITNVLNIVPTIQSYGILLLALFLEMEFWEDKFKRQIINNFFEKLIDFSYIMVSQYSIVHFTIALIVGSNYVIGHYKSCCKVILQVISMSLLYLACKGASSENYKICSFDKIKEKIDKIKKYRSFLEREKEICNPYCVLAIEDGSFYYRGDRYTFFNTYYIRNVYLKKAKKLIRRFFYSNDKSKSLKKFLRGYSTIEMQLLRTFAIEEGYECIFRRKVFEILYSKLFWKNLRKYYKKCGCDTEQFKDFILYLYLRSAPCLNKGKEQKLEAIIRSREDIELFSKEELFILTLCFSGKIKRDNVLDIYENIIKEYKLNGERLQELVWDLNQ